MVESDQFVDVIQVEYNASGTTILKVLFVFPKAFTSFSAGIDAAYEKSTTSSAMQLLNVLPNPLPALESFDKSTDVNEVQP